MFQLFVPAGITSSLFSSLLAATNLQARCSEIVGLVRASADAHKKEALRALGVTLREYQDDQEFMQLVRDEALRFVFKTSRVLWLSPHDDVRVVEACSIAHMLVIGSGAVVDFYNGSIDLTTAPPALAQYIQGKLRMSSSGLSSLVTTIHPGFYLQDVPIPGGLHHETSQWMFADAFDETKKWHGAAKYVTPVSYLCRAIYEWAEQPYCFNGGTWYHCGSTRRYERWELRELATGKYQQQQQVNVDPVYEVYAKKMLLDFHSLPPLDAQAIEEACKKAAEFYRAQE